MSYDQVGPDGKARRVCNECRGTWTSDYKRRCRTCGGMGIMACAGAVPGWSEVYVVTRSRDETITLLGIRPDRHCLLAVTPMWDDASGDSWVLTHIPTGLRLFIPMISGTELDIYMQTDLHIACAALLAWLPTADWNVERRAREVSAEIQYDVARHIRRIISDPTHPIGAYHLATRPVRRGDE